MPIRRFLTVLTSVTTLLINNVCVIKNVLTFSGVRQSRLTYHDGCQPSLYNRMSSLLSDVEQFIETCQSEYFLHFTLHMGQHHGSSLGCTFFFQL